MVMVSKGAFLSPAHRGKMGPPLANGTILQRRTFTVTYVGVPQSKVRERMSRSLAWVAGVHLVVNISLDDQPALLSSSHTVRPRS